MSSELVNMLRASVNNTYSQITSVLETFVLRKLASLSLKMFSNVKAYVFLLILCHIVISKGNNHDYKV